MQSFTQNQISLSHPAEAAARLAMVNERIGAIDGRLAEIQQRLQDIDHALAAPAPGAPNGALLARLSHWVTALGHRHAAPAASSLS